MSACCLHCTFIHVLVSSDLSIRFIWPLESSSDAENTRFDVYPCEAGAATRSFVSYAFQVTKDYMHLLSKAEWCHTREVYSGVAFAQIGLHSGSVKDVSKKRGIL